MYGDIVKVTENGPTWNKKESQNIEKLVKNMLHSFSGKYLRYLEKI